MLLEGPAENASSPTISKNKMDAFSQFANQEQGVTFPFFNFFNKILKNIKQFFFEYVTFFRLCYVFLLERDLKHKNKECCGNPILYKMRFVSATKAKNCGEKMHFQWPMCISSGGDKTHHNITILNECKISTQTRIKLLICNVCIITLIK